MTILNELKNTRLINPGIFFDNPSGYRIDDNGNILEEGLIDTPTGFRITEDGKIMEEGVIDTPTGYRITEDGEIFKEGIILDLPTQMEIKGRKLYKNGVQIDWQEGVDSQKKYSMDKSTSNDDIESVGTDGGIWDSPIVGWCSAIGMLVGGVIGVIDYGLWEGLFGGIFLGAILGGLLGAGIVITVGMLIVAVGIGILYLLVQAYLFFDTDDTSRVEIPMQVNKQTKSKITTGVSRKDFTKHERKPSKHVNNSQSNKKRTHWNKQNIKKFLRREYPGWGLAKVSIEDMNICFDKPLNRHPSAVWGDFNGDGITDYAVQLSKNNERVLLSFLSPKRVVKIEHNRGWVVPISVRKKGEEFFDYRTNKTDKFPKDAISVVYCGKGSTTYLYKSGFEFEEIAASD